MIRKFRKGIAIALAAAFCLGVSACGGSNTDDGGAYQRGADALKNEDYDTAMTAFKTAVDRNARKAEAYRGQGIIYLKQDTYASAITMFKRSIEAFKDQHSRDAKFYEDVRYYLAEAEMKNGDTDAARDLYTDLTAGENPARAYVMRGVISIQQKKTEEALKDFDRAAEENPSYGNCIRIFEALSESGHKADGAGYLQRALKNKPESGKDYYMRGRVYYLLGNMDESLADFRKAINKGYTDAVAMLGQVCIENKETAAARKVYSRMKKENQMEAAACNGLALCDISDEKYEDALSEIEEGLKAAGSDSDIREDLRYNEIVAYERKLDFETARKKAEEFIKDYPSNQEAKREAEFLETRSAS